MIQVPMYNFIRIMCAIIVSYEHSISLSQDAFMPYFIHRGIFGVLGSAFLISYVLGKCMEVFYVNSKHCIVQNADSSN